MANYGRPMKGKDRRVPITVHISVKELDIVEAYVEQRDKEKTGQYSRSDFFNEAVQAHLVALGLEKEEDKEA